MKYLTINEFAKLKSCTKQAVSYAHKTGTIDYYYQSKNHIRIPLNKKNIQYKPKKIPKC